MEDTEGLEITSNFPCKPFDDIESLHIDDYLKSVLREVAFNLSPTLKYGLPIILENESLFISSPPGTYSSILSVIGNIHYIDSTTKNLQSIVVIPRSIQKVIVAAIVKKPILQGNLKK